MATQRQPTHAGPPLQILYDGDCGLCDRWVRFVLRADRNARFQFAPLPPTELREQQSVVFLYGHRTYRRSEAVLRALMALGFPYSLVAPLRWIPLAWRDFLYDWVARNRYRWFGRADACPLVSPELRHQFHIQSAQVQNTARAPRF